MTRRRVVITGIGVVCLGIVLDTSSTQVASFGMFA